MIQMIQNALALGYTASHILGFLQNKVPRMSQGIQNAKRSGYREEDILRFLQGKIRVPRESQNKQYQSALNTYYRNAGLKTPSERKADTAKFIKGALGTAATAFTLYRGYQGLSKMFSGPSATGIPYSPEQMQPEPIPTTATPVQGGPPVSTSSQEPVQNVREYLSDRKLGNLFGQLSDKLTPNQVGSALSSLYGEKGVRQMEKDLGMPISQIVEEFKKQQPEQPQPPQQAEEQPQEMQHPEEQQEIPIEEEIGKPIESAESLKKGDVVATPSGMGEVKGISGNNFLIEENGKLRQVPMSELRAQPEAIEQAKIVFDPSKVSEEMRSAALGMAIPLPDRSGILTMFGPGGDFYFYKRKDGKPLDEDVVKRITEGMDLPITTGASFMGAWDRNKPDSRGAAAYQELTKRAQRSGDQDDPNKDLIFDKIEDQFIHGYFSEFMKLLREAGKQYGAKTKKERRKKT